jgi:hypothetical protein
MRVTFRLISNTITIRLPQDLADWLRDLSAKTGVPQGRLVRDQLERLRASKPSRSFMRLAGAVSGPRDRSTRKGFSRS